MPLSKVIRILAGTSGQRFASVPVDPRYHHFRTPPALAKDQPPPLYSADA
jgi:hypothetical protein